MLGPETFTVPLCLTLSFQPLASKHKQCAEHVQQQASFVSSGPVHRALNRSSFFYIFNI